LILHTNVMQNTSSVVDFFQSLVNLAQNTVNGSELLNLLDEKPALRVKILDFMEKWRKDPCLETPQKVLHEGARNKPEWLQTFFDEIPLALSKASNGFTYEISDLLLAAHILQYKPLSEESIIWLAVQITKHDHSLQSLSDAFGLSFHEEDVGEYKGGADFLPTFDSYFPNYPLENPKALPEFAAEPKIQKN
jgi:hypothetical protein